jgi:DNA-binding transcriptional regulator YdaS (Cro superfamily)
MKLRTYLQAQGDEAASKLLGHSIRTIRAWRAGERIPRLDDVYLIEKRTRGRVTCKEMAIEAYEMRKKGKDAEKHVSEPTVP